MMLTPPFRYRATVERDVETGVDGRNNPLPPDFQVLTADQPCDFWVTAETLVTGPNVTATGEIEKMLVPKTADVLVGDEITEVRLGADVVQAGRLRVVNDLPMPPSHRELHLELTGPTRPAAGS